MNYLDYAYELNKLEDSISQEEIVEVIKTLRNDLMMDRDVDYLNIVITLLNYISESDSYEIGEIEKIEEDAYDKGYSDGYEEGKSVGYDDGYDNGYDDGELMSEE